MLELEHRFRVVDVHAYLPVSDATDGLPDMSPDRLERELQQAGIVHAVVTTPYRPDGGYLRANNTVARQSVDRPLVAFARIAGPADVSGGATGRIRTVISTHRHTHTTPDDIRQYAYDDRFYGFALDPARDGLPDKAMLDALEDAASPVLIRGGEEFPPGRIAETLFGRSFPLIIAHFGGYPLNSCW